MIPCVQLENQDRMFEDNMFYKRLRKTALLAALALIFAAIVVGTSSWINESVLALLFSNAQASETALVNGQFYTVNHKNRWAEAVAIEDGNIVLCWPHERC